MSPANAEGARGSKTTAEAGTEVTPSAAASEPKQTSEPGSGQPSASGDAGVKTAGNTAQISEDVNAVKKARISEEER